MAKITKDGYGKDWILENGKEILASYYGTPITVRQLYYRLVALGLPNGQKYYKRVVSATTSARKDRDIDFDAFIDREREPYGETDISRIGLEDSIDVGKGQLRAWVKNYHLNAWHFQSNYVEVWIEKKALQGVFENPCLMKGVGLFACKGYPSLTALYEASKRFHKAKDQGKTLTIIYFGDHDPSGDDIPRSIVDSLADMGIDVELDRRALTKEQVIEFSLPPAPTKQTDSRTASWDGLGQVELDAVEPKQLRSMVEEAISEYWSESEDNNMREIQSEEKASYREALMDYVISGELESDLE